MLLHSVWGEQVYFIIEPHAICNDGTLTTCMSDGYVYGNHPYYDVTDLPFAEFPTTYEEAMQHLDRTNWAVVNNPNPADRLYLRGKASIVCICARNPTASRYRWASSTTERLSMWTKSAANGRMSPSGVTSLAGC